MAGFNGTADAGTLHTSDVVNNLTNGGTAVPLSAEMGKTLNDKFSTVLEWVRVTNEESTAGADFDKTVSVSIPSTAKEVMFTIQRVSNGRTIASSIVPFQQFAGATIYAIGSYQIFGNAISSLGNFILINAACINLGNGQIEIACTCANINESLRFRVFYR